MFAPLIDHFIVSANIKRRIARHAHSTPYTIAFAAGVSIVCGVLVAGSAVALKPRQEENKTLDQRKQVLSVAGLLNQGEALAPAEINSRFDQSIVPIVIDLEVRRASS
jgi:Na+-transporting NADH:ubiquinone oxidoreductase subunit C